MQPYAKFFVLVSSILFSYFVQAAVSKYPVVATDRMQVSIAKAQITVSKGQDSANVTVQTTGNCRELQSENQAGILKIYELELLKPRSENSNCQIQILIPILQSVQVHLLDGSLTVQKINIETLLHLQKGKVLLKETSGSTMVYVQKGELTTLDCQGQIKADLAQGQMTVRNLQGDLDIHALNIDLLVEKSKGQFHLNQSQGTSKILGSGGSLQFETSKAAYTVDSFAGRIDGQSQEGSMQLKLAADFDAHIKSSTARVSAQVPKGMLINVMTQEGELVAPAGMSSAKEGSSKFLRGRVPGDSAKGSLTLRSQEGGIFLK